MGASWAWHGHGMLRVNRPLGSFSTQKLLAALLMAALLSMTTAVVTTGAVISH